VKGDLLESSQFYSLVRMDMSHLLLLDLTSQERQLTIVDISQLLEHDSIEFNGLKQPVSIQSEEEPAVNNMVKL
jgi:hypothetical protein